MKTRYDLPCNIAQTLNIIGVRWTMLILHELLIGQHFFNDIKNNLPGLSANVLSTRLRSLEEEGLVEVQLYQNHPPRYAYYLTELGLSLSDIFNAMIIWGSKRKPCYKELVDQDTGEAVEIAYISKTSHKIASAVIARPIASSHDN